MKKLLIVLLVSALVGASASAESGDIGPASVAPAAQPSFQERMESAVQAKRAGQSQQKSITAESPLSSNAGRMVAGLAMCVGVFLIGAWLVRRASGKIKPTNTRSLRVVERMPITSKTSLMLVEVDGRRVMISAGPDKVSFFAPESGMADTYNSDALTLKEELIELCEEQARFSA